MHFSRRQAEISRLQAEGDRFSNWTDIPSPFNAKYQKAVEVGIAIKVISISHLDIAENTFQADFNLNVAWKGTKEDMVDVQIYNACPELEMDPKEVKIDTHVKASPTTARLQTGVNGFDWYYRIRYKGTFRKHYNLEKFPLDSQELIVRVRLKSECKLVALLWDPSGDAYSVDADAIDDGFDLVKAEVRHEYLPSFKFGKKSGYDPEALVVFCVSRKPDYWVSNFGLLMSAVATCCLVVFALPVGDIGDRLGVGFTLNLTVVATFYLIQANMPSVSYFTLLDRHMLLCIAYTMVVMGINCLPAIVGEELMEGLSKSLFFLLVVFWVCYHVWARRFCVSVLSNGEFQEKKDLREVARPRGVIDEPYSSSPQGIVPPTALPQFPVESRQETPVREPRQRCTHGPREASFISALCHTSCMNMCLLRGGRRHLASAPAEKSYLSSTPTVSRGDSSGDIRTGATPVRYACPA